jgi:hypothetical protein
MVVVIARSASGEAIQIDAREKRIASLRSQ